MTRSERFRRQAYALVLGASLWAGIALRAEAAPLRITVNCRAGQTITDALARGARTWEPLTITVRGTCREAVLIRRDDTTLRGSRVGDGLDGRGISSDLIQVEGHRVVLDRLTLRTDWTALVALPGAALKATRLDIEGAQFGISLLGGSTAEISDATIRESEFTQVYARNATLSLNRCLIEDGRSSGVGVSGGSGDIRGCTIRRNEGWGVSWSANANGTLYDSELLENSSGIYMTTGASALLGTGARVTQSRSLGIQVRDGSVLYLGGGASVERNAGGGIWMTGGSFVLPIHATISENDGAGIYLSDTSLAGSWNAPDQPVIQDNTGWGVYCDGAPAVAQVGRSGYPASTVTGNGAGASNCPSFRDPDRVP